MGETNFQELCQYMLEGRRRKGLTQLELARKLGMSSPMVISNWERGITSPPLNHLSAVIRELNLSPFKITECILIGSQRIQSRKPTPL